MPLGLGQGNLAAPWDLALALGPMEPPPHTLVKGENAHHHKIVFSRTVVCNFTADCK